MTNPTPGPGHWCLRSSDGSCRARGAVLAYSDAFRQLSDRVKAIVEDLEQSVGSISGGFAQIASRARQSVAAASAVLDDASASSSGFTGALNVVQQSMGHVKAAAEQTSDNVAEKMRSVDGSLRTIAGSLLSVEELALEIKLLGLNARIEAARAGEQGKSFAVVAEQTKDTGVRAASLNESIKQGLESLMQSVQDHVRDLCAATAAEEQTIHEKVDSALDALRASHLQMLECMHESMESSDALARDISTAIVALQYQDRVGQQLTQLSQCIEDLGSEIAAALDDPEHASSDQWEATCQERQAIAAPVSPAGPAAGGPRGADDEGDVELF